MLKLFPIVVGLRYTRAKHRNQFLSFISLISLFGMILGVVALIVVLSVMNGFEAELRQRVLGVLPHALITASQGNLQDWQSLSATLQSQEGIVATAPYIGGPAMLSLPGIVRGVQLTAILPEQEKQVSIVHKHMIKGELDDLKAGQYGIILGAILAKNLELTQGDSVSVVIPKVTITPLGIFPRLKRFKVVGIFEVGAQLDSTDVFIHLRDGAKLYRSAEAVHGIRLRTEDLYLANTVIRRIEPLLPANLSAKDWSQTQGSLFQAVRMEKTMIAVLLTIVVAVAAFNIISILTMMVTDKKSDIAVLRTMGASPRSIMAIFVVQGMTIGALGVIVGTVLGVLLALNIGTVISTLEQIFQVYIFDPSVYFITAIPSVLKWGDVAMICASALLLSFFATLYPSYYAAKIQPAEALRYE